MSAARAPAGSPVVTNTRFGTRPVVIHASGNHSFKPYWPPIKEAFFASGERRIGPVAGLSIFTCNNGNEAMGMVERSLEHLGVPYAVAGRGIDPWVNSEAKPRAILEHLAAVDTELVLYVDSRDALVLDDPHHVRDRFVRDFSCDLLFGTGRFSFPPLPAFEDFEESVAPGLGIREVYLQGGTWIGRADFCREFFAAVAAAPPVRQAPHSEQGLLRQAFAAFHPRVQLDYECRLFQNVGYLFSPILEILDADGNRVPLPELP